MRSRALHGAAVVVVLAGCATGGRHLPGSERIGVEMILPLGAAVAEQREHDRVLAPALIEAPLPAFPEGVFGDVDSRICAEIVVTAGGSVASVVQLDGHPGCESPDSAMSRLLFPSVAESLGAWQFFAGGRCIYVADERECERPDARIERLAKVDTEAEPGLGGRFGIRSIPMLALFAGGRELARQAGAMGAADIFRWAQGHLPGSAGQA